MPTTLPEIFRTVFGNDVNRDDVTTKESRQTGQIADQQETVTDSSSTQQSGTVTATQGNQRETSSNTTRLLSEQQINAAGLVLDKLSSEFDSTDLTSLAQRILGANNKLGSAADLIFERALGADAAYGQGTTAILENARKRYKQELQGQLGGAVAQAGSQFNSIVQRIFAQGEGDLELGLAALEADENRKNRQLATSELMSALQGIDTAAGRIAESESKIPLIGAQTDQIKVSSITDVLNAIKGGVTTSSSLAEIVSNNRQESQTTVNTNSQQVTNMSGLRDIDINETSIQVGKGRTDEDGLLDRILDLL